MCNATADMQAAIERHNALDPEHPQEGIKDEQEYLCRKQR